MFVILALLPTLLTLCAVLATYVVMALRGAPLAPDTDHVVASDDTWAYELLGELREPTCTTGMVLDAVLAELDYIFGAVHTPRVGSTLPKGKCTTTLHKRVRSLPAMCVRWGLLTPGGGGSPQCLA